jgi:hypothetical protein
MNLHREITPLRVPPFPGVNEKPGCDPKKVAQIREMRLALKVALDALDLLEASIPKGSEARIKSGPAVNRFASRIAEGLSKARAAV